MTSINFRVDDNVKKRAENACKELGLSMSTALNIYLIKLGNERRIPFEVSADPFYSIENMEHLDKIADNVKSGKSKLKEHNLIED